MLKQGYVQVYTGNGKGKTTALLGAILRATGAGLRVYFCQFLKGDEYSEIKALKAGFPQVTIAQYNADYIMGKLTPKDLEEAQAGLQALETAMLSGQYDVIAVDEINVAMQLGLLDVKDVLTLLEKRPANVELILTGRGVAREIALAADLVTDMQDMKHYYNAGVAARVGIEL